MSTSNSVSICPRCGARLPSGPVAGLCLACLLDSALHDQSTPDEGADEREDATLPETSLSPKRIGRYRVIEEISRGGIGVVYRAKDEGLKREVAVKVLHAGPYASRESVRRLFLEASAAARLSHPNIVPVHEIGGGGEGSPFLVMPYFEGGTAATRWGSHDGQKPSLEEVATLTRKIALAVHHAHQHGILHRDLKPGNILFDKQGEPFVADFGLARFLDEDSSLTLSHAMVGTPTYMSPEQAIGSGKELTIASDIHALGAILYEWIAGMPPYVANGIPAVLKAIAESEPVCPLAVRRNRESVRNSKRANPESFSRFEKDLETICLKCLEKEPARRYGAALELAEDLQHCLEDKPILASPLSRMERAWRWSRRNPMAAGFVTAAALLILTVSIGGPIVATREAALAREVRRASYASDLPAAWHAWDIGNVTLAQDLLSRQEKSDLREFTWRHLAKLCEPANNTPPVMDPSPHTWGGVMSRDGRFLATGGMYGYLTIWDVATKRPTQQLNTGNIYPEYGDFSPDASLLVSTGGHASSVPQNDFRVWDVAAGSVRARLELPALAGEFSPDGRWFACGMGRDQAGELVVLDAHRWQELKRWKAHASPIWVVRWSHAGDRILTTGDMDHATVLWDVASQKVIHKWTNQTGVVTCAAFSPDDRVIVSGSKDSSVRFWDTETGRELPDLRYKHSGSLIDVRWSSDGKWIASSGHDGLIKLRNANTALEWTLRGHSMGVNSVGFALNNTQMVSISPDRTIRFWDPSALPPPDTPLEGLQGHRFHAPVAFSPDGTAVATTSQDGTELIVTETLTGVQVDRFHPYAWSSSGAGQKSATDDADAVRIDDLVYVEAGRLAITLTQQDSVSAMRDIPDSIRIIDLNQHRLVDQHDGSAPLSYSSRKHLLASQEIHNGTLQVLDLHKGTTSLSKDFKSGTIFDIAFSPDGELIAVSGLHKGVGSYSGYGLYLAKSSTLQLKGRFEGEPYKAPINALGFTADGTRLITVGLAAKVQVWDVKSLRLIAQVPGHTGHGRGLAISPDGRTLATGSNTGVLKLWSLNPDEIRPKELLTLRAHEDAILSLVFSTNGNTLASGGRDGTVRLWHAVPDER